MKGDRDVVTLDVHTAKALLGSGYCYLDVRTVEEFNKSHVENALNVPYMFKTEQGKVQNPDFLVQVAAICKKEDRLVVACNSGGRSFAATLDLLKSGFKHVVNMDGGYSAWVDSGLAGETDESQLELKTVCKFRP